MDLKRGAKRVLAIALSMALGLLGFGMTALAEGAYTPGVYSATAQGFGGEVTVTVEVSENEIVSVAAVGDSETAGIGSNAIEMLPGEIVEKQTLKVDAVSGCTVTSEAVLAAAADALRQSGASDEVIFAEPAAVEATAEDETIETNILIVGAGAAGLSAALSAHNNGVEDITVIEKCPRLVVRRLWPAAECPPIAWTRTKM